MASYVLGNSSTRYKVVDDYIWKNSWITTGSTTTAHDIQHVTWRVWNRTGSTYYTVTEEQRTWANATWFYEDPPIYRHPAQDAVWQRWEVQERETREQEQARLDREQAAREAASRRRLEMEARREANALARAQAHDRGMELLEMIMSAEELLMLENTGLIRVRGASGKLYEIDTQRGGVHGNIYEVDEHGCKLANLCVAPSMRVESGVLPLSDGYVGQYLAIKHNEAELRGKANFSMRRACTQPNVPILGQTAA